MTTARATSNAVVVWVVKGPAVAQSVLELVGEESTAVHTPLGPEGTTNWSLRLAAVEEFRKSVWKVDPLGLFQSIFQQGLELRPVAVTYAVEPHAKASRLMVRAASSNMVKPASLKIVCATKPEACPAAVSVYLKPTSCTS